MLVLFQAVVAVVLHEELVTLTAARNSPDPHNPFATLTGFRVNDLFERKIELRHKKKGIIYYFCTFSCSNLCLKV